MKLVISGSRHGTDSVRFIKLMTDYLKEHPVPESIIVGDAKGIDHQAKCYFELLGIPVKVFKADWKTYGKAAGPIRNFEMISEGHELLVFPAVDSIGTIDCIKAARNVGMPVMIYNI